MNKSKSLKNIYPGRWDIPLFLIATFILLGIGISLPVLSMEKLIFWEDSYTILSSVANLLTDGYFILAFVIFFFSIVFPFSKLLTFLILWYKKNRLG